MSEYRDFGESAESSTALPRAGRNLVAVIGIDAYEHWGGLHNAVNDARGVRDTFAHLGFEIAGALFDGEATRSKIHRMVDELEETVQPDDRLVVFFAGHGWSKPRFVGDSELHTGYLIPVDGSVVKAHAGSWINVHELLRQLSMLKALHVLVIIDACNAGRAFSSVFENSRGHGSQHEPYESVHKRRSRMLIASTLDDEVARDGGIEPNHSLFTTFLLEGLRGGEPAVELGDGRRVIHGSALGQYVRHRVQCHDGDIGIRQTPGYGGFSLHKNGEIPIPLPRIGDTTIKLTLPTYMLASDPAFVSGGWTEPSPEVDQSSSADSVYDTEPVAELLAQGSGRAPRMRRSSSVIEPVRDRPSSPNLVAPHSDQSTPRLRRPTEPPPILAATPGRPARSIATLAAMGAVSTLLGLGGIGLLVAHRTSPSAEAATVLVNESPDSGAEHRVRQESTPPASSPPSIASPRLLPLSPPDPVSPKPPGDQSTPTVANPSSLVVYAPDAKTGASKIKLPSPRPGDCFAEIHAFPGGVEVVRDGVVVARTRNSLQLVLPCNAPATLQFRKLNYSSVTRTFVPTQQGTLIKAGLQKTSASG